MGKQVNNAYFGINIKSRASWGFTPKLMQAMHDLKLDVIDHRSWHARFEDNVINEMYVKSTADADKDSYCSSDQTLNSIKTYLEKYICQDDACITVTHWKPGTVGTNSIDNIFDHLLKEASSKLRKSENQSRGELLTFNEIKDDQVIKDGTVPSHFKPRHPMNRARRRKSVSVPLSKSMWKDGKTCHMSKGESRVNILSPDGEIYAAQVKDSTLANLKGNSRILTLVEQEEDDFKAEYLDGLVRKSKSSRSHNDKCVIS